MTFYWWSHWFWITTLSSEYSRYIKISFELNISLFLLAISPAVLLSITFVHTYPSQEISLEYNQNSKSVKAVTKLHQTATSLEWSTTTPTTLVTTSKKSTGSDEVVEPITQQKLNDNAGSAVEERPVSEDLDAKPVQAAYSELENAAVEEENIVENADGPTAEEGEYKRSAESYNKTIEDTKGRENEESVEEPQVAAVVAEQRSASFEESRQKLKRADKELSNYTNSSRKRDEPRCVYVEKPSFKTIKLKIFSNFAEATQLTRSVTRQRWSPTAPRWPRAQWKHQTRRTNSRLTISRQLRSMRNRAKTLCTPTQWSG